MRRAIVFWAVFGLISLQGCSLGAGSTPSIGLPGASTLTPPVPTPSVLATPAPTAAATDPTASPTASTVSPASSSPAAGSGCTTASIDYAPGAVGTKGAPATLARAALTGLQPSDEITVSAGDAGRQVVRVVRDGAQIAELHYVPAQDGGWLLETAVLCNGLRLR